MNKTIGIVTWIGYPNYGTYLQAFALREIVSQYNFRVGFIDDGPLIRASYTTSLEKYPILRKIASNILLNIIKFSSSVRHPIWTKICKSQRLLYSDFQKKYLPLIKEKNADILIAGSDQIWSPPKIIRAWIMRHYFLADFNGPKIAYAPSLSFPDEVFNEYAKLVFPWLNEFRAISAREPRGAELLSLITNRNIPFLVDPTLLLSKDEWIRLLDISKIQSNEKYCFCYLLTYRKDTIDNIREYANRHKLKIKIIPNDKRLLDYKDLDFMIVGPKEFLYEMLGAECVITDSFHGTIFSTIFEKPRVIIKRFSDNEHNQQNQRIRNLLQLIKSEEQLLTPESRIKDDDMKIAPKDWRENIYPKLSESINFLKINLDECVHAK